MLSLPDSEFDPSAAVAVEVRSTAKICLMGAWYSVPSTWRDLDAMAYVGVDEIVFTCRGKSVTRNRQSFGGSDVRYRDYLPELARKPQAVRQVAHELIGQLGGPYSRLWELLIETHGDKEAARVLAKVIAAIHEHGEPVVAQALRVALDSDRADLLALAELVARPMPVRVQVPDSLADVEVESSSAADFDALLVGGDA